MRLYTDVWCWHVGWSIRQTELVVPVGYFAVLSPMGDESRAQVGLFYVLLMKVLYD
jgi:hypothetical protein